MSLTFYDVPYVTDPDILQNEKTILTKDKVSNYKFYKLDNQTLISFVINDPASYQLIPHMELAVTDNQVISSDSNLATFSGRISDPKAIIKVSLNSKELTDVLSGIDPQTGSFSFAAELDEGSNLIELSATSDYGKIDKIVRMVQYQKPSTARIVTSKGISPINIIAIGLAVLAIALIWAIRLLARRK